MAAFFAAGASAETFQFFDDDLPFYLEGLDGVVAVTHLPGETDGVTSRALDAFPTWRVRTLFAGSASAELPGLTLFAHPAASATRLGFPDGPGAPPPASSTLSELAAVLSTGDLFLSPVLVTGNCFGMVVNVLHMTFPPESDLEDQLTFIESVGGVVLLRHDFTSPHYLVRLEGARTAFEVMEVAEGLMANPELSQAVPQIDEVNSGDCQGPAGSGDGTGGSGGTGGGAAAVAVPVLGGRALTALAALLVCAGLVALARDH